MEKKQRSACLYKFTRNYNLLIEAINDASPESGVTPQFEKLKECWFKLEEAHDDFITATDIDIENDAGGQHTSMRQVRITKMPSNVILSSSKVLSS